MSLRKTTDKLRTPTVKGRRLNVLLRDVSDNIFFNDEEQIAWYRLGPQAYDWLEDGGKLNVVNTITTAYSTLMGARTKPLECMILSHPQPFDVQAWLRQSFVKSNNKKSYREWMTAQAQMLKDADFNTRHTYFGVKIGNRHEVDVDLDGSEIRVWVKNVIAGFKAVVNKLSRSRDIVLTEEEDNLAHERERAIFDTISRSALAAERVSPAELLYVQKSMFYPAMPVPALTVDHGNRMTAADLVEEFSHVIDNTARDCLRFEQIIDNQVREGWRSTMTLLKTSKDMSLPESMTYIQLLDSVDSNASFFSRFTLYPVEDVQKALQAEKKRTKDQVKNAAMAASTDDYDQNVEGFEEKLLEHMKEADRAEQYVTYHPAPWFEGSFHVVVTDTTKDGVRSQVKALSELFGKNAVVTMCRRDEQAALFLEGMLGDRKRFWGAEQTATLPMLAATGANFVNEVGDRIEPLNNYVKQYKSPISKSN